METKQLYRLSQKWYERNVMNMNISTSELASWRTNITSILSSSNNNNWKHKQIIAKSSGYNQALLQVDYESLSFEDIEVLGKWGWTHYS